jgi:MFS family permease
VFITHGVGIARPGTNTEADMAAAFAGGSSSAAGRTLGRKLDSIPFSSYHLMIIAVLGLVGFVDGYDLVMTGSLLLLAKEPLHMTPPEIRYLAIASTSMICVGGFAASAISDHFSRKTIMVIGVAATTFFTLLIPLVQSAAPSARSTRSRSPPRLRCCRWSARCSPATPSPSAGWRFPVGWRSSSFRQWSIS